MTTTTIDRLRDVTSFCRQGAPLPPDLAGWLAAGIERFLGREARDLDGALGLVQAQGGIPWWREDAIRRRDQALRRLWQATCPDAAVTGRARRVADLLKRYAGSAWRHDRERTAMPEAYAGTAQEHLWQAFKSGAVMPLGERQLRTILGD
ncbi:MAG: hypothetical protein KIT16_05825 [Rhodospirillaceae bacterium]|nr:hypothetical protein [Rhodospirillaceae bacterium]